MMIIGQKNIRYTISTILASLILYLFIIGNVSPLMSQNNKAQNKIGIAFGGGAIKGIAHIGVIKVLNQEGIIPDYIAGTSIGAIVGGLYAMGYDTTELYHLAKSTPWAYYFNDDWTRTSVSPMDRDRNLPYLIKLAIIDKKMQLPKSFVYGEKLSLLLSRFSLPCHGISDFSKFKIPFSCVATELETGKVKVFNSGNLANAMRASMSLPSIFEPTIINNVTYIDGGITRNLPVQEVKDMGATFIIAVDVSAELYKTGEISTALYMLDQTLSYSMNASNETQRQLADVVIRPDIDGISGFDFDMVDQLLKLGEEAARRALPEIKSKLKVHNSSKIRLIQKARKTKFKINEVKIIGLGDSSKIEVTTLLKFDKEKLYTIESIEEKVTSLYTKGWVRLLTYSLLENIENGCTLMIDCVKSPNSWFKFGVNYDSDLKAGLLLNSEHNQVLLKTSTLNTQLRLSENPKGELRYEVKNILNANGSLDLRSTINSSPAFVFKDGRVSNEFKLINFSTGLKFNQAFLKNGLLSIGIRSERFTQNRVLFQPSKDEIRLTQTILPINIQYDKLDKVYFPNKGFKINLSSSVTLGGKLERLVENNIINFTQRNYFFRSSYTQVLPLSAKFKMLLHGDAGLIDYQVNTNVFSFYLGRAFDQSDNHVSFSGLRYMGITATSFLLVHLEWRYEVMKNIYLSLSGNTAKTKLNLFRQQTEKNLYGGSIELGSNTLIGPVKLRAEYGNIHPGVISYLHIGHYF